LNAGVVYLASVLGDSQLLRIQGDGRLNTLDLFKNIAPIRDAVLADLDESGEPSIVTCSGDGNAGSLRVIRNGVDVKELATIDGVETIRRTFTIRDPNIKLVLQSEHKC
jgi:DNA damage-binding protein 1